MTFEIEEVGFISPPKQLIIRDGKGQKDQVSVLPKIIIDIISPYFPLPDEYKRGECYTSHFSNDQNV